MCLQSSRASPNGLARARIRHMLHMVAVADTDSRSSESS
jgi:hypothetical protein